MAVFVRIRIRIMVFNATFNNISAISWQSVFVRGICLFKVFYMIIKTSLTQDKLITCIRSLKSSDDGVVAIIILFQSVSITTKPMIGAYHQA